MGKPIKIYGESKTGTTYLQKLLELNTDAEILGGSAWEPLGWKHGFPQSGEALYIFLFRDIYEWARSLVSSSIDKRFNGLTKQFGGTDNDFWNVWENPIKCRTVKYYSYLGFAKTNNTMCIGYNYLRNGMGIEDLLCSMAFIGYAVDEEFQDIKSHTYIETQGKDNPNRRDLTEEEIAFIDSEKDANLEQYVNQLTIE